jgi:hypothetical protein
VQHGELMAQHQDLDIFGTISAAAQHQQIDHEPDETIETGHTPILIDPSRTAQIETAKPEVKYTRQVSAPTRSDYGVITRGRGRRRGVDFETEPEFEERLVWMRAFIDRQLIPLEPIFDALPAASSCWSSVICRTR